MLRLTATREFTLRKYSNSENIIEHLNEMEKLRGQIELTGSKISEADMAIRILESLPSSWEMFKQSVRLNKDILKSYTKLKPEIIMQAGYYKSEDDTAKTTAIALKGTIKNRNRFKGDCYKCGKRCHMAKDCWAKKDGKQVQKKIDLLLVATRVGEKVENPSIDDK
jgi:hypothetical protein